MNYSQDERIVMTLDAGGTNFVFSALQGYKEITKPVILPSNSHDINLCIDTIRTGFSEVRDSIIRRGKPAAISFAFPGPADYPNGIIGDLENLPAFRGGVPLGSLLEAQFGIPVFINNDGDLFAYGEAIAGFLPMVNTMLKKAGSSKRLKNLIGVTLGTGFGAGIVVNNNLLIGDNAAGAEISCLRNKIYPDEHVEESVSIRGIKRAYARKANILFDNVPEPKDIYAIGIGKKEGNRRAAIAAFLEMGEALGDALANVVTLIDGIIVIGGGLSGAYSLFIPAIINEMNGKINNGRSNRILFNVFNFEDKKEQKEFFRDNTKKISVSGLNEEIDYDPIKRIAVGLHTMPTNRAVAIGGYVFALNKLDNSQKNNTETNIEIPILNR